MKKFFVVISENSSKVRFFNDDKNFTVWTRKLGSFDLPLKGTGAKYGESVSTKILSLGISLNVEANSWDFLKVTTPLAEIYALRSNNLNAKSFEPVKQWINIFRSFILLYFLKISNVSFSAALVWTIIGKLLSCDAKICCSKHLIWSFLSEWL